MDRLDQALELERPAIGEGPAGPRGEVAHGGAGEDLVGRGGGHQAGGGVDGDAGRLALLDLDLAGMDAHPDRQPQALDPGHDPACTGEGIGGPREGGEEAVAGGVHLAPIGGLEGGAHDA